MFKKVFGLFFAFVLILSSLGQAYGGSSYLISMNEGRTLKINSMDYENDIRVLVEKGDNRYYYSLQDTEELIPLQLGTGNYSVKILENISGNRFKVLEKKTLNLNVFDEKEAFLVSAQPVVWQEDGQASKLAKALTLGLTNDKDKVKAVYDYMVNNISYDYDKIHGLSSDYVPNNDNTLETMSGICYDYSSLFGAMLRSLGIPTKLVKGYNVDINTYHAWNEVLIDDNWVIIDTTYDAAFVKANVNVSMIKSIDEYNKIREY